MTCSNRFFYPLQNTCDPAKTCVTRGVTQLIDGLILCKRRHPYQFIVLPRSNSISVCRLGHQGSTRVPRTTRSSIIVGTKVIIRQLISIQWKISRLVFSNHLKTFLVGHNRSINIFEFVSNWWFLFSRLKRSYLTPCS